MIDLAVVAIVKDEAHRIEEWIAFHQVVGVEHFFIYDNGSTDGTYELLATMPRVSVRPWPGESQQMLAYAHALNVCRDEARWLAFLDADEFLWSPTLLPLPTVLNTLFAHQVAAGACWAMFGTSGVQSRPKLVLPSFTWRARADNPVHRHIKSIVRPNWVAGISEDPHHFRLLRGAQTVDGELREVAGAFAQGPSWALLRINHYWPRSIEEARAKSRQRRADNGALRPVEQMLDESLNAEEDREILIYLELLERRLGILQHQIAIGA